MLCGFALTKAECCFSWCCSFSSALTAVSQIQKFIELKKMSFGSSFFMAFYDIMNVKG
jgi:hypothetical protein